MALGQVHHVDVIAHAGAIVGVIIVAKDAELLQLARGHLGDVGHQIIGNAGGILANAAGLVGADGVEVAQQHHTPLGVSGHHTLQDLFDHILGPAIGVGTALAEHILPQGHFLRHAIHRGRGGEHQPLAAVLRHDLAQGQGGIQIVAVIAQGNGHTLPHCLQAGEVNHRVESVLVEDAVHGGLVAHVGLVNLDAAAGDLLHPFQGLGIAVGIVIHHHHAVARLEHLHTGMAADKPGAAGQKDIHEIILLHSCKSAHTHPFILYGKNGDFTIVTGIKMRHANRVSRCIIAIYSFSG